jgi:hypothetical protein
MQVSLFLPTPIVKQSASLFCSTPFVSQLISFLSVVSEISVSSVLILYFSMLSSR